MRSVSPSKFIVSAITCLSLTASAVAQTDNLTQFMTKDALTVTDRAQIDVEISDRATRLRDATDSASRRQSARDRLIQTALTNGAKPEPLNYYAERVTFILSRMITDEKRTISDDAAMVLRQLDHPKTASAFMVGLTSPHTSTQYQAAAGLRDLRSSIIANPVLSEQVLEALARCGAKATNPALLRTIYVAADLATVSGDFALHDDQVEAYAEIFSARIRQLDQGATDEISDLAGMRGVAKSIAKADMNAKKRLAPPLAAYYQLVAERYADRDLSDEYIATFREFGLAVEDALVALLRSENLEPPGTSYAGALKARRNGDSVRDVRKAAAEMAKVVQQEPFSLP